MKRYPCEIYPSVTSDVIASVAWALILSAPVWLPLTIFLAGVGAGSAL